MEFPVLQDIQGIQYAVHFLVTTQTTIRIEES
jgi:hypothetical protein